VAIGIGRGIGGVGGPPAFQRGLLPDQAGGGAGGDIVESYHGQNGGGLWLAQAAAPAARPNAAPTGTPPSGAPSTFNVRTFVGCMAIMAAANPAPFVGCGAGLLGCSRGNLEGCKQILGTCPEAGGMTVVCGAAASSALK